LEYNRYFSSSSDSYSKLLVSLSSINRPDISSGNVCSATIDIDRKTSNHRSYFTANILSSMSSSSMERGIGGRIEDAFAAAKDRGEAAFVSFVTAGYPTSQGKFFKS